MLALLLFAPLMAGCAATPSDIFSSDLLSKDAEWFSRSGRLFIKNVSIETPPLTPDKPVASEDLVDAEGSCPGMASAGMPANANALSDGAAAAPTASTPERSRLAIPNAMSCVELARPTTSTSPTIAGAIGWRSSTLRGDNAPASIHSHPGA